MPFKPSIKIISIPKPNDQVTHHVIVHVLPKSNSNQKVLVEVSNKVYLAQNNVADVKIIKPFNNEAIINSSIPDIQVKVFVYDSLNDKITNAYSQLFQYSNILATLNSTDIIKSTVPNIVSDWSKFKVKKKQSTANKFDNTEKPKTKVHFTIGVFFDGTGNNRFNSEKVYYKHIKNGNSYLNNIPEKTNLTNENQEKYDIDSDSSYWNPYSNVVLLHDLYETKPYDSKNKTVVLKQYIQGIGTLKDFPDDSWGTGFGEGDRGIIGKVIDAANAIYSEMAKILSNDKEIGSVKFDVFGFSRGAAAARHFCNEILNKNKTDEYLNTSLPYLLEFGYNIPNPLFKSNFTNDGSEFLNNINQNDQFLSIKHFKKLNPIIEVRFLGLFDTVVSQMFVKNHYGKLIDGVAYLAKIPTKKGSNLEKTLDIVKQKIDNLPIKFICHLTTADEWRQNFELTKIGTTGFEYALRGAHSDIGGGYAATKQEKTIIDYEIIDSYISPKRLKELMQFYIDKGYCVNSYYKDEINLNFVNKNNEIHHYLIARRTIIPRYSVIPLNAMKNIAGIVGVKFSDNNKIYNFEYEVPKDLKKYNEYILYTTEKLFREKYKEKIETKVSVKKIEKIENKVLVKLFNNFIHLSANYNSRITEKFILTKKISSKDLDTILYANIPSYKDKNKNSYERKIFKNNNK